MTEALSGYDRKELEKYYTPEWAVHAVMRAMNLPVFSMVYDPAAGDGAVIKAAHNLGYPASGSDIAPDADHIFQADFLSDQTPRKVIITNPPYGAGGRMAVSFIKHALEVTQPLNGRVAMLLRADFDSAPGRVNLFRDNPAFHMRAVLLKRVKWTNVPQVDGKGPSQNHTWFCWDWSRPVGKPSVEYIA